MDRRPKCYIMYCQVDIDINMMACIVKWMREICHNKIEFLFDGDVKYGESYEIFEKAIYCVDSIMIFFTPEYKKRCLDEDKTGVSSEYRKLLCLLEEDKQRQRKEYDSYIRKRTMIYPILFKGEKKSSITEEFINLRYLDMSNISKFSEEKDGHVMLSPNFISNYRYEVLDILREITTSYIEKTDRYRTNYDSMLKNLFITTKGEHIELPRGLFIKTEAYNKIVKQQKYLIIGRKGSGKTTVKNTIVDITGDRYKGIISIIADQFSIDQTYELLFNNNKINSDMNNCLSQIDTYKILWNAFIILYCILVVYKEYLNNNLSCNDQLEHIESIERTLLEIFGNKKNILDLKDEDATNTIYFHVLSNLENYIEHIIKRSRNDIKFYKTDIKLWYSKDGFLKYLIGDDTFRDFYCILGYCQRKIFITLDGFDTNFEIFKKTTLQIDNEFEKRRRIQFENLWLTVFVESLLELKTTPKLNRIIDLCLTLPVDRIETIKNINRDFYKYHAYTVALSWNSKDLINLIIRRLEYLNSMKLSGSDSINVDDLNDIMRNYYPAIPELIQLDRSGFVNMPLFLYILRKSFWRPRDIIRYYGCILSLSISQKKLDDVSIKRAIKDEALRIIQDEFFGEFSSIYTNLKIIVNLFDSRNQILSFGELYDILKNNDIIIDGSVCESDFVKKLRILYLIGFLGVKLSSDFKETQYLYDEYAFVFTEGTSLLRILESEKKYQCEFVIHPIFTEYLFLQVDYDTIICNYTWEYVKNINCNNIDYVMFEE